MRFTLGRVVHFYYVLVLIGLTSLFAYGVKNSWETGLLNIEYISNLYDGTSKVHAVKERGDVEEIKKFVDGDRIKDANRIFTRLEQDIMDLKSIKSGNKTTFDDNTKKIKVGLANLQSSPELTTILNNISTKITTFENFVTERRWPTLTKMAMNLRVKTSPSRLMQGGLFNFDKTQNLTQIINNDVEAITNFTTSSGLAPDIKSAIIGRFNPIKSEVVALENYIEEHKKFNRAYKEFAADYHSWFKFIEPEIAFKKIQFEKSSQSVFYSLVTGFLLMITSIVLGFIVYSYSVKRGSKKVEKLILDTIKDGLIPVEVKGKEKFSPEFRNELDKYRDYIHKRMSFGSIFQEAMPFASILLDSNLNLVWGNSHFYEQWQLQNFNADGDDSLTWDFLKRFTNLEDNSSILSALRMSTSGVYKIQVKNAAMAKPIPYEMHVSPVDYSSQKRIMIIFYPMSESEEILGNQKVILMAPMLKAIDAYLNDSVDNDLKNQLRNESEKAGVSELYSKFTQYVEKNGSIHDDLACEIERLESDVQSHRNIVGEMRKSLVVSFENQKSLSEKYNQFKSSVTVLLDGRDQLEEQFMFMLSSSRDINKDQNKILANAEKSEKSIDDYVKTLKTITGLKAEFKDLRNNVEEFKSRITQSLDQLLIFQHHNDDTPRIDQFLGKIKLEMKGFEKVLNNFNQVVTQLDITVTKIDMMVEGREKIDLESARIRIDSIKNNLENAQFSASRIVQNAHSKDDDMINILKILIINLKSEMSRVDEMCRLAGLTSEHLKVISSPEANPSIL